MSGHSKWANIQATKTVQDKRRAAIFTKYARLVTVAAREGGGADPAKNFKLRVAVEKARSVNMPKENIERAIARGAGGAGGEEMSGVMYEALALGGRAALLIACSTDNKNRAVTNVKTVLNKQGATMGASGSVSWMFDHRGVVRVENLSEDRQLELIDSGALDFVIEEGGVTIYTAPDKFWNVLHALDSWGVVHSYSELDYVPKTVAVFSAEEQDKISKLVEVLENTDDVESVWTNA